MRIKYVTADDASKPNAENNGYYIGQALIDAGASLHFANLRDFTAVEKVEVGLTKFILRAQGYQYRAKADPRLMWRRAAHVRRNIREEQHDLVLANSGPTALSAANGVPFAVYTDAPIIALKEMGYYLDDWAPRKVHDYIEQDKAAAQRAAITIYHSQWAADWAIERYGVDPGQIAVVLPGANIPWVPLADADIAKPKGESCQLLFFGRDWFRKGGLEAHEITRALQAQGVPVRLHICGPKERPKSTVNDPSVVWHPPINKLNPKDFDRLRALMHQTDYLLLPTRADTSTSAIREACAYGVPSITTAVGGLGEMILDGTSGLLIRDQDYASVADAIARNFENEVDRSAWRAAARTQYEERMNWLVAGRQILSALESGAT